MLRQMSLILKSAPGGSDGAPRVTALVRASVCGDAPRALRRVFELLAAKTCARGRPIPGMRATRLMCATDKINTVAHPVTVQTRDAMSNS